jgi:polar amino acid transport system substrate-binding protein
LTAQLATLARGGVLRAAINTGNRALVQVEGGALRGVSPALAERLAAEIGARLEPVVYDGAGKVFADAGTGAWDVAFMAVDPARADSVAFTRPYVTIEATCAARAGADFAALADIDRPGVTVLTATGSAYDLHLTKSLRHARLDRAGTPDESFAAFRAGRGDVVAGVRQSLERFFDGDAGVFLLPGSLTAVRQAMALPGAGHPALAALDDFVARAISDGFVAEHAGAR